MHVSFDNHELVTASLMETVEEAYPGSTAIPLGPGELNSVVRVDEVVIKSPLVSDEAEKEILVQTEAAATEQLPDAVQLTTGRTILLPQLIDSQPSRKPPYNVLRFVQGEQLPISYIASFTEPEKAQLGKDIGSLVAWLSQHLPEKSPAQMSSLPPKTAISVLEHFWLPRLDDMRQNGFAQTAALVKELLECPHPPHGDTTTPIAGHGDLHAANLTFQNRRLQGVFDFGNMAYRDPADELRWTYFMGETAAKEAARQYTQETGTKLSVEQIAYYAGVQAASRAASCAVYPDRKILPAPHYRVLSSQYAELDLSELEPVVK